MRKKELVETIIDIASELEDWQYEYNRLGERLHKIINRINHELPTEVDEIDNGPDAEP